MLQAFRFEREQLGKQFCRLVWTVAHFLLVNNAIKTQKRKCLGRTSVLKFKRGRLSSVNKFMANDN